MVDSSLESLVEEFVEGKPKDVIELEFLVGEETIPMHSVEEGSSFEQSSRILFFKSKQLSGCFSEFGEEEVHSPDLSLILQPVFADKLKLVVDSFLFERPSGGLEGGGV